MKSACGPKVELFQAVKGVGDRGGRKHRAARGLRERDANSRRKDAGSAVQQTSELQMKASDYPHAIENQLFVGLSEKPTLR